VSSDFIVVVIAQTFALLVKKVKQVIKVLEADGWYLARTRGSHRQYKHPSKSGTVTVSGKSSVDVPIGTLKNIWRQAQIEEDKI
jgi:predicted RNA binding protein YcfA (HicA-like mRNA interferase family)